MLKFLAIGYISNTKIGSPFDGTRVT